MKWLNEVWISELQIFKWSKSLIFSQFLPRVRASIIKVCVKPFDLASASLVLLSSVRLATVSISTNQSSVSNHYHWRLVYSGLVYLQNWVFFWAVHRVSMYCCSTSSRGSSSADGLSTRDKLFTFLAIYSFRGSAVSILCCKWFNSLVMVFSVVWFSCSIFSKLSMFSWWYLLGYQGLVHGR